MNNSKKNLNPIEPEKKFSKQVKSLLKNYNDNEIERKTAHWKGDVKDYLQDAMRERQDNKEFKNEMKTLSQLYQNQPKEKIKLNQIIAQLKQEPNEKINSFKKDLSPIEPEKKFSKQVESLLKNYNDNEIERKTAHWKGDVKDYLQDAMRERQDNREFKNEMKTLSQLYQNQPKEKIKLTNVVSKIKELIKEPNLTKEKAHHLER